MLVVQPFHRLNNAPQLGCQILLRLSQVVELFNLVFIIAIYPPLMLANIRHLVYQCVAHFLENLAHIWSTGALYLLAAVHYQLHMASVLLYLFSQVSGTPLPCKLNVFLRIDQVPIDGIHLELPLKRVKPGLNHLVLLSSLKNLLIFLILLCVEKVDLCLFNIALSHLFFESRLLGVGSCR